MLAYPTQSEFERAAKAFIDKYKDVQGEEVGPSRTNRGWEWKESQHKVGLSGKITKQRSGTDAQWTQGGGYLYRKLTRHVRISRDEQDVLEAEREETNQALEDDEDAVVATASEPTETTSLLPAQPARANGNGNGNGKLSKSQKKKKNKKNKQRQTPTPPSGPQAQQPYGGQKGASSNGIGKAEHVEKIEVEHNIIYSKTYHVPQLLIRAWNSSESADALRDARLIAGGAPLSLNDLLKYRIVHSGAHLPDADMPQRGDALMLDPHSPFPLLQQLDHPVTGEVVWSVHPCQVGQAVEEVLLAEREDASVTEGQQRGGKGQSEAKGNKQKSAEQKMQEEESVKERQLRWLETWMMLSSGVVDLTA